jgi:DNA modification methylase
VRSLHPKNRTTDHPTKRDYTQMTPQTTKTRLNDLTGKEWVKSTKSVWGMETLDRQDALTMDFAMQHGLLISDPNSRDELKKRHPATFPENDIAKLIRFFTKPNEIVMDPFLGSGSSALASLQENRNFIGIELYKEWLTIAEERIANATTLYNRAMTVKTYQGDSLIVMKNLLPNTIDFIVTSPPYWGILSKKDHKANGERIANGLETDYGESKEDLANIKEYKTFLETIQLHTYEYHRLLRHRMYMAIVVSDFRHGKEYYMLHSDIARVLQNAGFTIQGLITLAQDNKKLYPYGYPTAYVPNISNQFIVIGRKL